MNHNPKTTKMHTPEQAKALWCPMVRIARREVELYGRSEGQQHVVGGCNTDALEGTRVPASCRCIAAECAMWRWHTDARKQYLSETPEEFQKRRLGYYGLAPNHSTT